MNIRLTFPALILVALFSSVELTAQTSKTTTKKTATQTESQTRERRTEEKKPATAVTETPAAAVESKAETPTPASPSPTPVQSVQVLSLNLKRNHVRLKATRHKPRLIPSLFCEIRSPQRAMLNAFACSSN